MRKLSIGAENCVLLDRIYDAHKLFFLSFYLHRGCKQFGDAIPAVWLRTDAAGETSR